MKLEIILSLLLTIGILGISLVKLKDFKFDIRSLTRIGIMSAISIILFMIKIIPFPNGGGVSFLSVLPIMLLSIISGIEEALLCGIVVAILKSIILPPIHPFQFILDYFCATMVLGFTPIMGAKEKPRLALGALLAGFLSINSNVLAGVMFFGQFAPEGLSVWKYSITYNYIGYGTEIILSVIVLTILPLKKLKQIIN